MQQGITKAPREGISVAANKNKWDLGIHKQSMEILNFFSAFKINYKLLGHFLGINHQLL